jgi:hypothetical protein
LEEEIGTAGKVALLAGAVLVVFLCNLLFSIQLPGMTKIEIRPQIVLIAAAGYILGPVYGFAAGLFSNLFSDLALGYGVQYFLSWTAGNGLIGALAGLCPLRRRAMLDKIGQLGHLTVFFIAANILPFAYATGVQILEEGAFSVRGHITYFFLPAVLSNIVCMLVLLPVMLLAAGRMRLNFPVRIAFINYYLTTFVVFVSWGIFAWNFLDLAGMHGSGEEGGNAFVVTYNHWTLLLVVTLFLSFAISGWVSRMLVSPITQLEHSVYDVLRGHPDSLTALARFNARRDEIGLLGRTISLLGEKLIHTQAIFRGEMNRRMNYVHSEDSASDLFLVGIVSLFGGESYESADLDEALKNNGKITNLSAVRILIDAAGLRELASTYSEAKVRHALEATLPGLDGILKNAEEKQALALALDLNLIFKGRLMVMDFEVPLESDFAFHLLQNAQSLKQGGKHFIGHLTDNDIFAKMEERWFRSDEYVCPRLQEVLDKAVRTGRLTGYQLKKTREKANFDESLRIAYCHSNFRHVKQLAALLVGEGVEAKVQLEGKVSAFLYRKEWGAQPDLALEDCGEGLCIARRKEFDVVFEFATAAQRDRFRELIQAYAKKESDSGQKLLFESWFQPLFSSSVRAEGYQPIADIFHQDAEYTAHAYCKTTDAPALRQYFAGENLPFESAEIWANDAFCRYLNGEGV